MLRGLYSAAAGMVTQMTQSDTVADNLANVSTTGFKRMVVQFQSFADAGVKTVGDNQSSMGIYSQGSEVAGTMVRFDQGPVAQTGNPLDVAIQGDGFFEVRLDNGELAYTRAGRFTRDAEGYLVTVEGQRVQGVSGANGDIIIPRGASNIEITPKGKINATIAGAQVPVFQEVGQLKIVQFEDNNSLERTGASLYKPTEEPLRDAENYTLMQGHLEQSNVNPVRELVDSMIGLRVYESLQRNIRSQNETLRQSTRDVGRVR